MEYNFVRYDIEDENLNNLRKTSYWEYVEIKKKRNLLVDNSEKVAETSDGLYVFKQLLTPEDADYEAYYMKHSIGYSWDVYSTFGRIFSMRNQENIPEVTFLVDKKNIIIHARRYSNYPVSNKDIEYFKEIQENLQIKAINPINFL